MADLRKRNQCSRTKKVASIMKAESTPPVPDIPGCEEKKARNNGCDPDCPIRSTIALSPSCPAVFPMTRVEYTRRHG